MSKFETPALYIGLKHKEIADSFETGFETPTKMILMISLNNLMP